MIESCVLSNNRLTNLGLNQVLNSLTHDIIKLDLSNNKIAKLEVNQLEDTFKNQNLSINYNEYIANGTNYYPSELAINIRAEKNLGCTMKLFNFAFEKKREPQIRVPASYKTISH